LELNEVLGNIPQKTFTDTRKISPSAPLVIPEELSVREALQDVLGLVSVGSKRFLVNKVDRAVSGLIAGQQCCGPLQLTVADVAVVAQSHFSMAGGATAIGEQPIKMVVDPAAGARLAVGESLTNLVWAGLEDPEQIKCSANWMWAPKLPGEGAALNDAARAMRDAMIAVGMAVDGGKDSLSMATMVGDEVVKSPRQLVISAYAAMPDITKKVTPDIKRPGESVLLYIDLSGGKNRLGGTALAQTLGTLGNETPDMDDPALVKRAFAAVQRLLGKRFILAGHDRSDGGLITTVLEMAFSGNCGLHMELTGNDSALAQLFSEELGLVLEVDVKRSAEVIAALGAENVPCLLIAETVNEQHVTIGVNDRVVLSEDMRLLRSWWEETSYQLECLQNDPECAEEERNNCYDRRGPKYRLSFTPRPTPPEIIVQSNKPKVAIMRDEGSNSDREMTSAFYAAGFEPWDVCMTDFLEERIKLDDFRGLAAVGGFSYADVPESAKGWAATILFNEKLKAMFQAFYDRPDTFTLGICNGCQLFGLLGWVPFQGLGSAKQPRFVRNRSGRFESRWTTVKIMPNKSLMLQGMEGLVFGIHVDHGEGRLHFPESALYDEVWAKGLVPLVYTDDEGGATEAYPFNPNGSPGGLAGLCSPDGRHLAMMPHPERAFLPWQAHYLPEDMKNLAASPWLKMFQNAHAWCVK
ncbi:MAG: phosphoribosylformylglycinamidine synthase, partial [Desulfobulbaceae bacterium]|nr:phosphoribosylformylglycinamidine synthase [Desulfobulbaceae bacterium]